MSLKAIALRSRLRLKGEIQSWRNRRDVYALTQSDQIVFHDELKRLLKCNPAWLEETAIEYRDCPAAWRHLSGLRSESRATDGIAKSLDVAEGFALWALVKNFRPRVVVEIGVQYGVSAKLWKEALKRYVPRHELILCDTQDQRLLIQDNECNFILGDALETLPQIFKTHEVDILHNDAHPYKLIHWSVDQALEMGIPILTFHDVGCKHPRANFQHESYNLSPEEKHKHQLDLQKYGHWERHVMAEIFDPRILTQESVETENYRMQVFDSLFGIGVVLKNE